MTNSPFAELSMFINKVSVDKSAGGLMRWRAVASDTSPDLYSEKMSNDLFDDFISRIKSNAPVPSPFDEVLNEDWNGGMPYISISHYKSGTSMKNVPGIIEQVYRDGDRLKATGNLHDNDMGRATFKSLCDDLYTEKAKDEGKIRISIGFLDLEHKHLGKGNTPDFLFTRSGLTDKCPMCQEGNGNKVYTKGQLVHLALTRVPVNPRTDMEVNKMAIETKKDDAASIIGIELANTLEEKSLLASDVLVVKSEEPVVPEPEVESVEKSVVVEKKKLAADAKDDELTYDEADEEKREQRRNRPAGERSMLENSYVSLEAKIEEMKSQGVPAETALREIQPLFAAFGEQVKKSFEPAKVDGVSNELSELVSAMKSLAENMATFQQSVSTELATLKAQVVTKSSVSQGIPEPRSITSKSAVAATPQRDPNKPLSIHEMALRSTFQ